MERLGKLAEQNRVKNVAEAEESQENTAGSEEKEKEPAEDDTNADAKTKQEDPDFNTTNGMQNKILVDDGDILARYRIPVQNNKIDYDLQLPDYSDSSNFSSDQEKNDGPEQKEEGQITDNKIDDGEHE